MTTNTATRAGTNVHAESARTPNARVGGFPDISTDDVSNVILASIENPSVILGTEGDFKWHRRCGTCHRFQHHGFGNGACVRHVTSRTDGEPNGDVVADGLVTTDTCDDWASAPTAPRTAETNPTLRAREGDADQYDLTGDNIIGLIESHSTASAGAMSHLTKLVWRSSSLLDARPVIVDDETTDDDFGNGATWYSETDDGALVPYIETTVERKDKQGNSYLMNIWVASPRLPFPNRIDTTIPRFDGEGVMIGATEYLEKRLRSEGKSLKAIDDALAVAHRRIRKDDSDFSSAYDVAKQLILAGASDEEIEEAVSKQIGATSMMPRQPWQGQELVHSQPENEAVFTPAVFWIEKLQREWGCSPQ